VDIYYHPACTCRMGPSSDPLAVVDPTGKVHGLDGLYVCDASIFPTLMRANTNLPAAMIAEHLAAGIGG
jgi:choline dehydrogenase